jgi:hypothetical protein
MLAMGRPTAKWIGIGAEPRLLAGFDVTVRLEKHRHKRPGEGTTLTFRLAETVSGARENLECRPKQRMVKDSSNG